MTMDAKSIKLWIGGPRRLRTVLKILVTLIVLYALFNVGVYFWPRVQCAALHPPLKADTTAFKMKGCWVVEDSSALRGYTTFTFSEWPPSDDSRRLKVTVDTDSDANKLATVSKPVSHPWGQALEIIPASSADAPKSKGALLYLPEHRVWLSTSDATNLAEIESLTRQ